MYSGPEILETNVVCDTPLYFTIREYCLNPLSLFKRERIFQVSRISLGKYLKMRRIADEIGLNLLDISSDAEIMHIIRRSGIKTAQIIAIASLSGKEEVNNTEEIKRRGQLFSRHFTQESLLDILYVVSKMMDTKELQDSLGITEELKKRKGKKATKYDVYGGLTIWGNLLGPVLSKYHWTFDYMVWEVSFQNLIMLLADEIQVDYDSGEGAAPGPKTTSGNGGARKFEDFGVFIGAMKAMKGENP